jgi:hypothetical protein
MAFSTATDTDPILQVHEGLIQPRFLFPDEQEEGMWAGAQDPDGPSIDTALLLPTPLLVPRYEVAVAAPASPVSVAEETVKVPGGMLMPAHHRTESCMEVADYSSTLGCADAEEPVEGPVPVEEAPSPEPSNDDSEPNSPPSSPPGRQARRAGGTSSSQATRRVDRPLRKNTGVQEDFPHTPLTGAPTNGVTKLEFFGEYLKTLLLEAPQPLPLDTVCKIVSKCRAVRTPRRVTKVCAASHRYGLPIDALAELGFPGLDTRQGHLLAQAPACDWGSHRQPLVAYE